MLRLFFTNYNLLVCVYVNSNIDTFLLPNFIKSFGILILTEMPELSWIIMVFNQNVDLSCLHNTTNSFKTFGIFIVQKTAHNVEFSGMVLNLLLNEEAIY